MQQDPNALAFSLGTRLMVFRGRSTLSTLRDLIVFRFLPADPLSLILQRNNRVQCAVNTQVLSVQRGREFRSKVAKLPTRRCMDS
jgi:hypothetical protein